MIHEQKEEPKEQAAVRILTHIAKVFKNNHESTVCFDKDIVLDAISFLEYAENEGKLIGMIKSIELEKYGFKETKSINLLKEFNKNKKRQEEDEK